MKRNLINNTIEKYKHLALSFLIALSQVITPTINAADSSVGTLNISGNVPIVFSLTTRGVPGDLDLSPSVTVNDRLLGIIHFKYNVDIASIDMSSDTVSGSPETGGTAYSFGTAFKFKITACTTIDATYEALFAISNVAVQVEDPAATSGLTDGVEEDCDLTASWGGTTASLPLAGKYSMVVTFTMTSI